MIVKWILLAGPSNAIKGSLAWPPFPVPCGALVLTCRPEVQNGLVCQQAKGFQGLCESICLLLKGSLTSPNHMLDHPCP